MNAIESSNLAATGVYNNFSTSTLEPPLPSQAGYQSQPALGGPQSNQQVSGNNIQIVNHFGAPCERERPLMDAQLGGYRYGESGADLARWGGNNAGYLIGMLNTLTQMVSTLSAMIKGLFNSNVSYELPPSAGGSNSAGVNQSCPATGVYLSDLPPVRSALDVNSNDNGVISVRTLDGYTIRTEGRDQAWSITGPDGKTTRIWGDPHVSESDGDKWDFLNRSTFMFGLNKATIEVVPAANGQTFSARLTIYSDRERVTIDGIDKDKPVVTAASSDGLQHDAVLADGEIYSRIVTNTGEAWVSEMTGRVVTVTR
jgi:hypothetical protein